MHVEPFYDEKTFTLTYVVYDEASRDAVVIDPVLDYEPAGGRLSTESLDRVADFLKRNGLQLRLTLETHAHADHLSGAQWLKQRFDSPVAVSERIGEVQAAFRDVFDLGADFPVNGQPFDRLLRDGERVQAGTLELKVLATPGHTPACTSFLVGDAVFTGDAVFLDDVGVGRCDFPKGDAAELYRSVTQRLWTLPPKMRLFPGHDYPSGGRSWQASTTVEASRKGNVQLHEGLTEAEFVAKRTARDRTLAPPRLLFPAVQVNVRAGHLPPPAANGRRYLKVPLTEPSA